MNNISELVRLFAQLKLAEIKAQEEVLKKYLEQSVEEVVEEPQKDELSFEDEQSFEEFQAEVDEVLNEVKEEPKDFETLLESMNKEEAKTKEDQTPEAPEESVGDFICTIGKKHQGKALKDIEDLEGFTGFLEKKMQDKPNVPNNWRVFVSKAKEYIKEQEDCDIPF